MNQTTMDHSVFKEMAQKLGDEQITSEMSFGNYFCENIEQVDLKVNELQSNIFLTICGISHAVEEYLNKIESEHLTDNIDPEQLSATPYFQTKKMVETLHQALTLVDSVAPDLEYLNYI